MTLDARKYGTLDFVRIPLKIAPGMTILYALCAIVSAMVPTCQLLLTAAFVDGAKAIFAGEATLDSLALPSVMIALVTLFRYAWRGLSRYSSARLDIVLNEAFRGALTEKRSRMAYEHVENNDTWELIARVSKKPEEDVAGGLRTVVGLIDAAVRMGGLLIVIAASVWWMPPAIILVAIPLMRMAVKSGQKEYDAYKEARKYDRRAEYLQGVLTGRENVEERALFGYSDSVNGKWLESRDAARKIWVRRQARNAIKQRSGGLAVIALCALVTLALIGPFLNGAMTLGVFAALVSAIFDQVNYIAVMIPWQLMSMARSREYMRDLTAFAALGEQAGADGEPERLPGFELDKLEFSHVTFKYPGTERYILKDFSVTLRGGTHYAFVGVNGAGKTTITKLLTGLYPDYEGNIYLNGRELREYSLPQRKAIFSVVYQDFAKYYVSARDNVALGRVGDASEEGVAGATELAGLSETIAALPNGLDTPLGKISEGGVDISGGQWQRFAIARSIASGAPISILDEPTAALDPVEESRVYELFGKISEGKSTIFITHRLGAARLADEIIVIDEGRAAEQGSHEKLMAAGGLYARMFESQRSWYEVEEDGAHE